MLDKINFNPEQPYKRRRRVAAFLLGFTLFRGAPVVAHDATNLVSSAAGQTAAAAESLGHKTADLFTDHTEEMRKKDREYVASLPADMKVGYSVQLNDNPSKIAEQYARGDNQSKLAAIIQAEDINMHDKDLVEIPRELIDPHSLNGKDALPKVEHP